MSIQKILISPDISIKSAIQTMEEDGRKILFVTDSQLYLLGTVTDGDIRRAILKSMSLESPISTIMNPNPIYLDQIDTKTAKQILLKEHIECIPIVNNQKQIQSAIWWKDIFDTSATQHKTINIPVVIMAGGKGTRLYPFTHILPKPLMPIGKKSIMELIIDRFMEYGCMQFYASLNYKANMIKAYFSDFDHPYTISYIQEDKPLGTAGSLHLLNGKINKTFCVTNCDILIKADYADIYQFHKDQKNKITLVTSMRHFVIPYGICEITKEGHLKQIKEKPIYDMLVNTGMYLLEPEVLGDIPQNKFFHITDLIQKYIQNNTKIGVYPVSDKAWMDMGQFEEYQDMLKKLEMNV